MSHYGTPAGYDNGHAHGAEQAEPLRALVSDLLGELRYVLETGNIPDSIGNSAEVRERAAVSLGFADYAAFGAWCDKGPAAPSTDPYETAARAAGWTRRGDNGGIIYHPSDYDSWKAAVSWAPKYGPTYDTWQECCEGEEIEPGDLYRVEINYQTATSCNTFRAAVRALNEDAAKEKATARLKADKRRRVVRIDGGSVELIPAAG